MNILKCKIKTRHGFVDRYVDGKITKCENNTDFFDFFVDGKSHPSLKDVRMAFVFLNFIIYVFRISEVSINTF